MAPIASATAMRFDCVYIVGMIEGAVPPAFRDDPLIPDSERRAAGGAAAGTTAATGAEDQGEVQIPRGDGVRAGQGTLVSGGGGRPASGPTTLLVGLWTKRRTWKSVPSTPPDSHH